MVKAQKRIDAVIPAGRSEIREVHDFKADDKARFPLNGKPMVEYVVEAVRASELVRQIALTVPVGTDCSSLEDKVDKIFFTDRPLVENIEIAVRYFLESDYVLLTSSDLPLLESNTVDSFIRQCLAGGEADLYYPIMRKEELLNEYPETKRTFVRVKEGSFTGGNLALVRPGIILNNLKLFERLYDQRRSPWGMAKVIGLSCALKLLVGILSIEEAEKRLSKLIRARGKAVITKEVEIAMDVDKKEDLILVKNALSVRERKEIPQVSC